jgi:hypothetical protein
MTCTGAVPAAASSDASVLPLIAAGFVTPSFCASQAQLTPPAPPPKRNATTPASR